MTYTVKQLAKLSGVTERTLRWYDHKGVLKPSYYGENGYRYYQREQLLMLQQILFFRELDFSLDEIRQLLIKEDFDKVKMLHRHRMAVQKSLERKQRLLQTIDLTIHHLKGEIYMKDQDLYQGFKSWSQGKGPESYFIGFLDESSDQMTAAEKIVFSNVIPNDHKDKGEAYYQELEKEYKEIYSGIADLLQSDHPPHGKAVQAMLEKHLAHASKFFKCTEEVYRALATLYKESAPFVHQLEAFHKDLPSFIHDAMQVFASNNL